MKVYIVKSYLWQDNGIGSGELNDHTESIEAVCSSMENAKKIKEKLEEYYTKTCGDDGRCEWDTWFDGWDIDIEEYEMDQLIDKNLVEDKKGV